jgi:hypothetical protein
MKLKTIITRRRIRVVSGIAILAALVGSFSFAGPYRPVEPLPPGIIDMHCHVAGLGAGGSGCLVSKKLRHSWRFKIYL